jgi:hypothetical protein
MKTAVGQIFREERGCLLSGRCDVAETENKQWHVQMTRRVGTNSVASLQLVHLVSACVPSLLFVKEIITDDHSEHLDSCLSIDTGVLLLVSHHHRRATASTATLLKPISSIYLCTESG